MSSRTIEGACLCGAIRYRITGELAGFQYCHCSRCRKFTGSAHAANCFATPDKLEWPRARPGTHRRPEDERGTCSARRADDAPPLRGGEEKQRRAVRPQPSEARWVPGGALKGESELGSFMLEAEPPFPTAFCKRCGSGMPSMSSTGKFWVIPAGSLEDDPGLRPARTIFWDSRAPWYEHVSDLPRHAEWPEE